MAQKAKEPQQTLTLRIDVFEDKDTIQVDFLIAPNMDSTVNQQTVVNDLVATAQETRKDCGGCYFTAFK